MARILIIDDSADERDLVTYALLSAGHVVSMADNGESGLALQRHFQAEILVTDIFMPYKDGIETIFEFKRDFPAVRIIAMSGSGFVSSSAYLSAARQIGADAVLHKPFAIQELLDAVKMIHAQSSHEGAAAPGP
jgi:DNA-binding response OmpR family regulator